MDTTDHTPPATQSDSTSHSPTLPEPMVQALVHKYQHLEVLHPLLQKLFESPEQKELFTSVTQHNYNMLMTRSQKLDDHEVNAYEKAFCVLMENEDGRIGGLEIYVEKILGVGELEGCASDEEKEKSMLKEVAVRALLDRVTSSSSVSVSVSRTLPPSQSQQQQQQQPETKPTPTPTTPPKPEATSILSTKLLPLYRTAKTDFYSLAALTPTSNPQHVAEKTKAAKFLRDTVENCIQYLTRRTDGPRRDDTEEGDERLMKELHETLEVAKEVAEVGSGGRKRRFDLVGGGQPGLGEKRGGGRDGRGRRGGGRGGVHHSAHG